MTNLERLMAALAKDPELEYQVWEKMHGLRYYEPWEEGADASRLGSSLNKGSIIAHIALHHNQWEGSVGGEVLTGASRVEVKSRIEAILWAQGWRKKPDV